MPPRVRDRLRYTFKVRGNSVTLCSERPSIFRRDGAPWVECVVAQFRFDPENTIWTLYCADRNSRWFLHDECKPSKSFEALLAAVDEDVTGIFFG